MQNDVRRHIDQTELGYSAAIIERLMIVGGVEFVIFPLQAFDECALWKTLPIRIRLQAVWRVITYNQNICNIRITNGHEFGHFVHQTCVNEIAFHRIIVRIYNHQCWLVFVWRGKIVVSSFASDLQCMRYCQVQQIHQSGHNEKPIFVRLLIFLLFKLNTHTNIME